MEANELRIGNYYWSGYNCKFSKLMGFIPESSGYEIEGVPFTGYLLEGCGKLIQRESLEPIPLTEEWLLKFGLIQMKDSITYEWKDGDYRSIQVDLKAHEAEIYLCGYDSVMSSQCFPVDHIQYVHEFQNLFFALKGKELTLK